MACFVLDVLWITFQKPLSLSAQSIVHTGSQHKEIFDYTGIKLEQIPDFFKEINQKKNIESISPVPLTKDDYQNTNRKLSTTEITELKGKIGKLKQMAGMILFL